MLNVLVTLVIVVVVVGLVALFLRWAMTALEIPPIAVKIIWVVFGLICFLVLLGLIGYGPMAGVGWR